MGTAPRKGLTPCRKVGSAPDNKALNAYTIASGYATALGRGDPVKLHTDGTLVVATNGADAIGVLEGVTYTDSTGAVKIQKYWPASTTATNIEALVMDDPNATFLIKGDGPIPLVQVGDIFALTVGTPDSATGRSNAVAKVLTEVTGNVDIDAMTDLGEDLTGCDDGDTFTIKTSQAGSATTITIEDGDGYSDLLTKLNAVDNITATVTSAGYINIVATDGYDLVLGSGVGAPLTDLGLTAATHSEVVAGSAGLVKVVSVPDRDNKVMEVVLVRHSLRDDD